MPGKAYLQREDHHAAPGEEFLRDGHGICLQRMHGIGGEKGGLNNNRMNQYNERLKAFAAQNGCYYVDIASAMKDSNGGLRAAYCSDKFVHLTYAGCDAWTAVLRNYVGG